MKENWGLTFLLYFFYGYRIKFLTPLSTTFRSSYDNIRRYLFVIQKMNGEIDLNINFIWKYRQRFYLHGKIANRFAQIFFFSSISFVKISCYYY